jgi:hypothetical protein
MDFNLLKTLCQIQSTSGDESLLKNFIMDFVGQNSSRWKSIPEVIEGEGFQDNLMLVFGSPNTAFYAHMDSVGFTTRYQNQLITIGSPEAITGDKLIGEDGLGPIECSIKIDKHNNSFHDFKRSIEPGTSLVYKPNFLEADEIITSSSLTIGLAFLLCLKWQKK